MTSAGANHGAESNDRTTVALHLDLLDRAAHDRLMKSADLGDARDPDLMRGIARGAQDAFRRLFTRDGHRSMAFAISPYTQTGQVDSTFYSTVSVLRTMELILGVPPMSQFDRAATPMAAAFSTTPNLRAFDALTPATSLTATNGPNAPMAGASLSIDFSAPDRIPMALMNEIIWRSVRGRSSEMPRSPSGIFGVEAGRPTDVGPLGPWWSSFLDR